MKTRECYEKHKNRNGSTCTARRQRAATYAEFRANRAERDRVNRENTSRRMRADRLPPLPVPGKLDPPLVRVAYDKSDGSYIGVVEVCPPNCTIKLEPARREWAAHLYVTDDEARAN